MPKKHKKKIKGVMIILSIITAFVCLKFYQQYKVISQLNSQIAIIQEEIIEEEEKQIELKNKDDYYKSDDYIKEQAREKFGLVSDDEIIFIIEDEEEE